MDYTGKGVRVTLPKKRRRILGVYCDECKRDVSQTQHIQTTTTQEIYCIKCFAKQGCTEPYRVSTYLYEPLLQDAGGWIGAEEIALIDALQAYGYSNWHLVSDRVGTRTPRECYDHYVQMYHVENVREPCSRRTPRKQKPSNPTNGASNGYMPKRKEFMVPYWDEADKFIEGIKFYDTDTPEEHQLKLDAIRAYLNIVKLRNDVTDFVVSRNLLKPKSVQCDKELAPLLQVMSRDEFDAYCQGLRREQELRDQIAQEKNQLSQVEWDFCQANGMTPEQYNIAKANVMHMQATKGRVTRRAIGGALYTFFKKCGWINK
jgi:transcriptional adapter 2-alpha